MATTRIPARNLDVLRALAVGCVFFDHLIARVYQDGPALVRLGRVGVLLFFVHTALVLMASLERHRETARDFFVRRLFRIYPLAVAVVIAIVLRPPASVIPRHSDVLIPLTARTLFANLTLTQNLLGTDYLLVVLWTLPIEVQMYAFLPLCYRVAQRGLRGLMYLFLAAFVTAAIVRWGGRPEWGAVATFAPCFISGVMAYVLLRRGRVPSLPAWSWPILLLTVIAAATALPWLRQAIPETGWPICIAVGLLVPNVKEMQESVLTRAAYTVAKYSYGIYLLHAFAFVGAFSVLRHTPAPVQWLAAAVLSALLPYAAYHLIEAPGISFGRRIAGRRKSASPADESVTPVSAPP